VPPVGCLTAAALSGGLAWTVIAPDRWLRTAALSVGIFGAYRLVRAHRFLVSQRRAADDWLRSATGAFVPPRYRWRAEQLSAPRERLALARTLRLIGETACERPIGMRILPHLRAVRAQWDSVQGVARALERLEEPVTPAGMLRVIDLVTGAGSALWGSNDAALGEEISVTLAILTPCGVESTPAVRAA
jgi:hypothetical protein